MDIIQNTGSTPANIGGYSLTDEDGNRYRFPNALPDVPAGAFVVVIFDGLGSASDDYDFADNLATLHSPAGLVNIFEDNADQAAVYSASSFLYLPLISKQTSGTLPPPAPSSGVPSFPIVSFVAWGDSPEGDDTTAAAAALWPSGAFVGVAAAPGADGMLADGSLGVVTTTSTSSLDNWVIYRPAETSQGQVNLLPGPFLRNPPDGIVTDDHQMAFGWSVVNGAVSYHLEVDDDANFGSPAVSVDVTDTVYAPQTPFPDGAFYFHVRAAGAGGSPSSYSAASQVTFITPGSAPGAITAQALLDVTPKLQHKDTRMLDLDGSSETGQGRWDSAHETDGDWTVGNGTPVRANNLDNMYCTRASISMIVAYHGGNLSMDRISYYAYGGGAPEGDLGHGTGLWPNGLATQGSGKNVFDWAMNGNAVTSSRGKPTFDQVKGWIDANRPLLTVENNDAHSVVLDGYLEILGFQLAHRVDPWTATGSWVLYTSWNISEYHVPPAGVTPRSDEDLDGDSLADTIDDSDGDGVVDFDEVNRFHGNLTNLDPGKSDSDKDLVPDKLDIREYVFNNAGNYSRRSADIDGDGDRKETDRDNDNFWDVGSIDGCEDTNRNGKLDAGETSNFNPATDQEKECARPTVNITSPPDGSNDDDCVITLQGAVTSDTSLTSLDALVTSGSQSNRFNISWSGSAPNYSFSQNVPIFSGNNIILVTAINEGASGDDYIYANCTGGVEDIHVQLTWPLLGSDVDTHLIRPGGTYFSAPGDCYYSNRNPDWGVIGDPSDNPSLDVDCISQCTVENIVLNRPENGVFTVKIHYFSDHGLGPTSPTVRIWVRGVLYVFGPHYLTDGQVWDVAAITWPAGTVSGSSLVNARLLEFPGFAPEK